MATAYVALGANEGDRLANLERAVTLLREVVTVDALSPIYETEPVGYADQPWFLNAAARAALESASTEAEFGFRDIALS